MGSMGAEAKFAGEGDQARNRDPLIFDQVAPLYGAHFGVDAVLYAEAKQTGEPGIDGNLEGRYFWRNRRTLGYHGLSLRSSSQRQSGAKGSMIHTGLPIAPAR